MSGWMSAADSDDISNSCEARPSLRPFDPAYAHRELSIQRGQAHGSQAGLATKPFSHHRSIERSANSEVLSCIDIHTAVSRRIREARGEAGSQATELGYRSSQPQSYLIGWEGEAFRKGQKTANTTLEVSIRKRPHPHPSNRGRRLDDPLPEFVMTPQIEHNVVMTPVRSLFLARIGDQYVGRLAIPRLDGQSAVRRSLRLGNKGKADPRPVPVRL